MKRGDEVRSRDVLIHRTKTGSVKNGYLPIALATDRGEVSCRLYPVEGTRFGAIWVGGVGGGWDSPALGLYPKLCEKLREGSIVSLRIRYRHPTVLKEAVYDVIAGITFLENEGISKIALTGHSLGGAVVIQAAALSQSVRTVVTLATQSYGADAVSELSSDCSVLLIHGAEDTVLPSYSSHHVYDMAHDPKKLIILEGNGHSLDESAREVEQVVYDWIVSELNS